MAFLSKEILQHMGFKSLGKNVNISDKASIYNAGNISIGNDVRIDDFCILSAGDGGIDIGDYVHIACYVGLIGKGRITLRDFVGISSRTVLYSSNDDYSGEFLTGPCVPAEYTNVKHGSIIIEKHVVVGTNCTILPGVQIGEGSAIGGHSLVNYDIPPHSIWAGVPAAFKKKRLHGIYQLEKLIK